MRRRHRSQGGHPAWADSLGRALMALATCLALGGTPGIASPRTMAAQVDAANHKRVVAPQRSVPPAPRSAYHGSAEASSRAEKAQSITPVVYKIVPNRFLQLCVAVYGEGGLEGLERVRKLLQLNRARASWGTDLIALDEELLGVVGRAGARAWISADGLMNLVIEHDGATSAEERRRVENLAKNTYGGRVQPAGLTGIWGAVAGISGEMTAQNPGRPVLLLSRQAVVCSSKNYCQLVPDARGGKAFGMLVETGQTWEISLNSGEAADVCCIETVPFPSIVINNAVGRHLRVMDLRTGAVYPWGQWPVEATPTPKPTPTPEKPKPTPVEVVSHDFDGKRVVVTDQKRLDQARDYFFNKWFGQTTGLVDALIPRGYADRTGWRNIPVKIDLSKGMRIEFLNMSKLTAEQQIMLKEGIGILNELTAWYDVINGQLVVKVFSDATSKYPASNLGYALTRLRDIYVPYNSDTELFRILVGDYPITKGGNPENFNDCLQLR